MIIQEVRILKMQDGLPTLNVAAFCFSLHKPPQTLGYFDFPPLNSHSFVILSSANLDAIVGL
jgi:hypothetical protein